MGYLDAEQIYESLSLPSRTESGGGAVLALLLLLSRCSVPGGGVVVAAAAGAAGAAGAGAAVATAVANREFNLETTQTSTLQRSLSFFSSII
ncbi:hypothetical protein V1477_013008 [Vespula maculifrons]|uniref:Uncharacterized protein n=1 Tax=Vespula maculifrons TaxID=7453 RepID=A0ABD2BV76_VESMC